MILFVHVSPLSDNIGVMLVCTNYIDSLYSLLSILVTAMQLPSLARIPFYSIDFHVNIHINTCSFGNKRNVNRVIFDIYTLFLRQKERGFN